MANQPDFLMPTTQAHYVHRSRPVPQPLRTEKDIMNVAMNYKNPLGKFTFLWLYLWGQRASEALQSKRLDLEIKNWDGNEYLVLDSITLKQKHFTRRSVPVPIRGILKPGIEWIIKQTEDIEHYDNIFNIRTRQNLRNQVCTELVNVKAIMPNDEEEDIEMNIYPHYLRHCRASHLVRYHNFNLYTLMQFFGWKSHVVASVYAKMDARSLAMLFK